MNLDHVAIQVKNLKQSIEWYVSNLNLIVLYQDNTWAMLEAIDGTKIALTIPNEHPPHIAFQVDSFKSFPGREIKYHRDGSAYLYTKDPSGNIIEYICWPDQNEISIPPAKEKNILE